MFRGGVPGARADIPWQPVEKTFLEQVALLQPMGRTMVEHISRVPHVGLHAGAGFGSGNVAIN